MPGLKFTDVRIEVDALKVGGERDNRFGIICRAISPTVSTRSSSAVMAIMASARSRVRITI